MKRGWREKSLHRKCPLKTDNADADRAMTH